MPRPKKKQREVSPLGPVTKTARGFEIVRFEDHYGHPCSLQVSSLATADAVWLGCDNADPQVLASQAHQFGIATEKTTGWIPYPVPKDVLLTTRMHLNRDQVIALIEHLQRWLNADTFQTKGGGR